MALVSAVQTAGIAVIFIVAIVMAVGYLQGNVPTSDLPSDAQTQINDTFTKGYTALKLIAVGLIMLGIGAFLYVIMGFIGGRGR